MTLYVALAATPLLVAAAPPRPPGRPFWHELGVALGFVALGQMALQFGLVGRFKRLSRPFGLDLVMQFHRQLGLLAASALAVHAALLLFLRPGVPGALAGRSGLGLMSGFAAFVAVSSLVLLTLARKRLGIGYESWRVGHALLSIAALGFAQAHVSLTGFYSGAPWKNLALVAFSGTCLVPLAYLRLVMPYRLRRRPWVVTEVRPEGGSTWTLALAPLGHAGLGFAPGQFAWLRLGSSPWSVEEHPFSLSSSAQDPGRVEFAIKELGDFTRAIGSTAIGTKAWIDGPHGSFSSDFHEAPAGFLFVSGGIGIAPALSMLRTLADRGDRRAHVLVYACSSLDRVSFFDELGALARRLDLKVALVLTHPPAGWSGPSGFLTKDILEPFVAVDGAPRVAFVCGPDAMMASVEEILLACGLPRRLIQMERFDLA
jgi:predicted ferric reductase